MTNTEVLSLITASKTEWNNYNANRNEYIDLSFQDLSSVDFEGKIITFCDLSGVQLNDTRFLDCTFDRCIFNGANFTRSTFVRSTIRKCQFANGILTSLIFRNSKVIDSTFEESNLDDVNFIDATIDESTFSAIESSSLFFEDCQAKNIILKDSQINSFSVAGSTFVNSTVAKLSIQKISLQNSNFRSCNILDISSKEGILSASQFIESRFEKFRLEQRSHQVFNMDMSGSRLSEIDMSSIGLGSATLLETSLSNCFMPTQIGKVTFWGKYIPNSSLMKQSVEDVKGLSPIVRRDISDAQYLMAKIENASILGSIILRVWGFFTGFGQSLTRLLLSSISIVLMCAFFILITRGLFNSSVSEFTQVYSAISESILAFFSMGSPSETLSEAENRIFLIARISGFFMLGFWVSIASTKLSKLGSS